MSRHVAPKMPAKRWAQIKRLPPNTAHYFHVSALAEMRKWVDPETNMPHTAPWIEKPGVTFVSEKQLLWSGKKLARHEVSKGRIV